MKITIEEEQEFADHCDCYISW